MALKSTVYKLELHLADLDRGYFAEHALTLARHPSETEERLMLRALAFILHAAPGLAFGRGLSTVDEPALAETDDSGVIRHWIEVGLPDEKALRRAAGRAERVSVLAYGGRGVAIWWAALADKVSGLANLEVSLIEPTASRALAALAGRNLRWQATVQEGTVWLGDMAGAGQAGEQHLEITPRILQKRDLP